MKLLKQVIDKQFKFLPQLLYLHDVCMDWKCFTCPYGSCGRPCKITPIIRGLCHKPKLPRFWRLPRLTKTEKPKDLFFLLDVKWTTDGQPIIGANNEIT